MANHEQRARRAAFWKECAGALLLVTFLIVTLGLADALNY